MSKKNILVIGAGGQIGSELITALTKKHPGRNIIASDIHKSESISSFSGTFVQLDTMDRDQLYDIIKVYEIDEVYQLAAMLSASAERDPLRAWNLNMNGLLNVLELGREGLIKKIFWPSSIAVFGPDSPKNKTRQNAVTNPSSVYGISKVAGEHWCNYYYQHYGLDVRSIRYPGLISYKGKPGGGTTDYAVHIFHEAIKKHAYTCFLSEDRALPMLFMDDAIDATLKLMDAPPEDIGIRTSYNLPSLSFNPTELSQEIKRQIPDFQMFYNPDFRDKLASSWPASIDGSAFQKDLNWTFATQLTQLADEMLKNVEIPA